MFEFVKKKIEKMFDFEFWPQMGNFLGKFYAALEWNGCAVIQYPQKAPPARGEREIVLTKGSRICRMSSWWPPWSCWTRR